MKKMNEEEVREITKTKCYSGWITFKTIITYNLEERTKYNYYLKHTIQHAWNTIYKKIKAGKKCIRTTFAEHLINPILCYIATDRRKYETIWLTHLALANIPKDVRKLILRRIVCKWPLLQWDTVIPQVEIEWKTVEFGKYNAKSRHNMVCVRIK